jgi:hypothetical protein
MKVTTHVLEDGCTKDMNTLASMVSSKKMITDHIDARRTDVMSTVDGP